MKLVTVLLVAVLGTASAQVYSLNNCYPNLDTMQTMDRIKYSGRWYEIKRSFQEYEENYKCFIIDQGVDDNLNYDVNITMVSMETNETSRIFNISANPDTAEHPERMTINPGYFRATQSIWILYTDYDHYAVAYTCVNSHKNKLDGVWILSRTPQLNEVYMEEAKKILRERRLHFKLYEEIQDCEYLYF